MSKKWIYLFGALVLPGLIFTFLKIFGKNEFDIPVYFEDGLKGDSVCVQDVNGPYHIPDSVVLKMGLGKAKSHVAIIFPFVHDDLSEVNRLTKKYSNRELNVVVLSGMPNLPKTNLDVQFLNYVDFGNVCMCWLRAEEESSIVLIDEDYRIRGYYDGNKREEIDRLDTELSILLKKY